MGGSRPADAPSWGHPVRIDARDHAIVTQVFRINWTAHQGAELHRSSTNAIADKPRFALQKGSFRKHSSPTGFALIGSRRGHRRLVREQHQVFIPSWQARHAALRQADVQQQLPRFPVLTHLLLSCFQIEFTAQLAAQLPRGLQTLRLDVRCGNQSWPVSVLPPSLTRLQLTVEDHLVLDDFETCQLPRLESLYLEHVSPRTATAATCPWWERVTWPSLQRLELRGDVGVWLPEPALPRLAAMFPALEQLTLQDPLLPTAILEHPGWSERPLHQVELIAGGQSLAACQLRCRELKLRFLVLAGAVLSDLARIPRHDFFSIVRCQCLEPVAASGDAGPVSQIRCRHPAPWARLGGTVFDVVRARAVRAGEQRPN